jgi:hypothetical protein
MNKTLARVAVACGAGLCALAASANPVVSFTPSTQHANLGDIVTVDVSISGLGAEVLSAFDLNFLWNGALMGKAFRSIDATSAQDQLQGGVPAAVTWAIDSTALGDWGLQASSLLSDADLAAAQDNAFLLASFNFSADADGVTTFGLGADADLQRNFVGLDFQSLTVDIGSACVAIGSGQCNIPEPSSYALVGLAMAGLMFSRGARRTTRRG